MRQCVRSTTLDFRYLFTAKKLCLILILTFLIKKRIVLLCCVSDMWWFTVSRLFLSHCACVRDDLFRVELDNVVGEEMFYSKVRTETHTRI